MLKLSDLTLRPDFQLGPMLVSPSRRRVQGPGGYVQVQPLIMQVFLMLLDAPGQVVTRNELFDQVWGGVMIGDDSLNRAIAKVRHIGAQVAPGLFEIETIPRTGYRLTGKILTSEHRILPDSEGHSQFRVSRRMMLGTTAAAGVAAASGLGLWSMRHSREDRRFNELMDLGRQAQLYGGHSNKAAEYFQQAAAMRPGNAKAQGQFALTQAMAAEDGGREAGTAVQRANRAARAALAVDPKEPNARLALVTLQRSTLDLSTNEDRLREILAMAPDNTVTMDSLWGLLQSAGRSRDALAWIERANAVEPFAAAYHYPKAQLLWILGRNAEADRVIDRAMQYWPEHEVVRFARFTIYAYTGRPRAALAMLDDPKTRPQIYSPEEISLWRVSLAALDQRTRASVAAARSANLDAARQNPRRSNIAILVLSALGEVDAAFEIANGLLLFRRPAELRRQAPARQPPVKSTGWRSAPWMFTPPVAPMRADPRFNALCDGIGLTEYWAKRGIKPDYQLGIT
jgi:DNA-binding winged helix-turn-helix (wHTH) protein/tetratricopeptide (TPR) repeat protein